VSKVACADRTLSNAFYLVSRSTPPTTTTCTTTTRPRPRHDHDDDDTDRARPPGRTGWSSRQKVSTRQHRPSADHADGHVYISGRVVGGEGPPLPHPCTSPRIAASVMHAPFACFWEPAIRVWDPQFGARNASKASYFSPAKGWGGTPLALVHGCRHVYRLPGSTGFRPGPLATAGYTADDILNRSPGVLTLFSPGGGPVRLADAPLVAAPADGVLPFRD